MGLFTNYAIDDNQNILRALWSQSSNNNTNAPYVLFSIASAANKLEAEKGKRIHWVIVDKLEKVVSVRITTH